MMEEQNQSYLDKARIHWWNKGWGKHVSIFVSKEEDRQNQKPNNSVLG